MNVKKFLHTRMRVSNMEQTIAFYQEVLGLKVIEQRTSPRGSQLVFLAIPNNDEYIELCCFPSSGPVNVEEDLVHVAFAVNDMDETMKHLDDKNIPITDGPTTTTAGDRFLFIAAPDGYEIELIQSFA